MHLHFSQVFKKKKKQGLTLIQLNMFISSFGNSVDPDQLASDEAS